jgi:hypothetical protein
MKERYNVDLKSSTVALNAPSFPAFTFGSLGLPLTANP